MHQRQFQITLAYTIIYIYIYTCTPIDPQKISKNYIYPNSLGCSFVSSRGTVRVKLSHVKYQHESEFYNIQHVFMDYSYCQPQINKPLGCLIGNWKVPFNCQIITFGGAAQKV